VVNVQASQWNEGESGKFTVNLGVYFPAVAEMLNLPLPASAPKEYDCTVRVRLPSLMHDGRDVWWNVEAHVSDNELTKRVGTAWSMFGRSWLERTSNLEGALDELITQKMYFHAAAISVLLEKMDDARELVARAEKRQPLAKVRIREWAKAQQLI
jgi:hypothetical protein